jgi:hypothetical protein
MKKNIFKRIYTGLKKGVLTPTLPANILRFQSNPIIRIFRVLGGLSILILLGQGKLEYSLHIFIIYLLLFIGFLFVIYHIVISYYRIKNIYKILNSDELDIKNSPLDRIATLAAKIILCAKGTCEAAQPIALSLGLMLGADEVIKAGGRDAIFAPLLAKIFVPTETETAKSARLLKKSLTELDQNTEDQNLISELKNKFNSSKITGGLSETEYEEFRKLLNENSKDLDKNRSNIIQKITDKMNKK